MEKKDKKEKKSFGYLAGKFIGAVLVTCIAICISAVMVALTARFIMWLI